MSINPEPISVSAAMRSEIQAQLKQLEIEQSIRILFAAESGSRAWGFASPNSDYDVRFVYVPAPEWYLSVNPKRDVTERMLPGDLDLSGWELRKALRLFKRYNGALNEWLGSPIQYRPASATSQAMQALLPQLFKTRSRAASLWLDGQFRALGDAGNRAGQCEKIMLSTARTVCLPLCLAPSQPTAHCVCADVGGFDGGYSGTRLDS